MNKKTLAKLAAFPAFLLATAGSAFAQAVTPTTATELAQSISFSDAQAGAMLVIKGLISMGVVLFAARMILRPVKPKV